MNRLKIDPSRPQKGKRYGGRREKLENHKANYLAEAVYKAGRTTHRTERFFFNLSIEYL
jgi:hypothetical protein